MAQRVVLILVTSLPAGTRNAKVASSNLARDITFLNYDVLIMLELLVLVIIALSRFSLYFEKVRMTHKLVL